MARVTLADVARRAGCSGAAVSLWVNGKSDGRLTDESAARIEAAVRELGYVPNRAAQQLALGTSQSVAFLFPGALYGDFFASIVDGVTGHLGPEWEMSFVDAKPPTNAHPTTSPLERALRGNPAALVAAAPSAAILDELRQVQVPTVVIDAPSAPPHVSLISLDLESSVSDLAAHLQQLGHHRVAYVSFLAESLSLASRRKLVRKQLAAHDVELIDEDLLLGALELQATKQAFLEIWPTWEAAGVTAVICADDRHAYGILAAARSAGIDIPRQLSVAGFNDLDPNTLLDPPLSAIWLPAFSMGELAADALAEHIRTGQPVRHRMATRYVPRASMTQRR
ncbi:LacI family transcriptional regulator [Plantibacter flavus]|uniref:LacI family DNA-binding transcriptional regulator n=1 Tax=Plantibacter flavus TaxID=150123 RepID=UPI003F163E1B